MRDAARNKERWNRRRTPTQDPSTHLHGSGVETPWAQRLDPGHQRHVVFCSAGITRAIADCCFAQQVQLLPEFLQMAGLLDPQPLQCRRGETENRVHVDKPSLHEQLAVLRQLDAVKPRLHECFRARCTAPGRQRRRWPALFQPHGKVRARPDLSGGALGMTAPYKQHGGNDATRSLRV